MSKELAEKVLTKCDIKEEDGVVSFRVKDADGHWIKVDYSFDFEWRRLIEFIAKQISATFLPGKLTETLLQFNEAIATGDTQKLIEIAEGVL